ncbi:MAG: acyl-CoA N-acyltransferase [Monoraphidium minutum]|nr:MAG: acyl-CoA N-acyltransferase [Monoraphidium minutum]
MSQPVYELLTPDRLPALRILNSVLFPVKFHDQVYRDALMCGDITQLAYVDGTLVGAIMCRLEVKGGGAQLYIVSLGVLAPYRGQGIASQLLARSLAACADDAAIASAALHVHSGDDEVQAWYAKRGFEVQERILGYYKRLRPPDALLLCRQLGGPGGGGGGGGEQAAAEGAAAGGGPGAEQAHAAAAGGGGGGT